MSKRTAAAPPTAAPANDRQRAPQTMRLADIKIGKRFRQDHGDIDELAASIRDVGLLHPPVVNRNGELIAGGRRLRACQALGLIEVPVTVVDLKEIIRGEYAENAMRKDFLPSEIDAIRRALEPLMKPAAMQRMLSGKRDPTDGVGKVRADTETSAKIGAFAHVSGRKVEKIARVMEAARREPKKYGHFVEEMDRTEHVDGVWKRLVRQQRAEKLRGEPPPPLPSRGPYRVIVADPPWEYPDAETLARQRMAPPYPAMTLDEICAMASDVDAIAAPDCILWLWVTNVHLLSGDASWVLYRWGFKPKTMLTWDKVHMKCGNWLRSQTEHAILATRGEPFVELVNQTTLLRAPATEHSTKPDEFYPMVERLCPAPRYAELFARKSRKNWDGHGDEIEATCRAKSAI